MNRNVPVGDRVANDAKWHKFPGDVPRSDELAAELLHFLLRIRLDANGREMPQARKQNRNVRGMSRNGGFWRREKECFSGRIH